MSHRLQSVAASYSWITALGPKDERKKEIKFKKLGGFQFKNRTSAFYRDLTAPMPWGDISSDAGFQDFWQVWLGSAITAHLSKLADKYPDESRELTTWLESFDESPAIVIIGEHEWISGLDT